MGFIDELVGGISREVGKVQARSQEMMQTYTLLSQIRELERKKTTIFILIGRMICDRYQKHVDVPDSHPERKAEEIAQLDREIAVLQSEMDSLKVQNDPQAPASKRADAKAGFNPTPGYECPNCHAPASKDKSFCPVCGESIKSNSHDDDIVDVETN